TVLDPSGGQVTVTRLARPDLPCVSVTVPTTAREFYRDPRKDFVGAELAPVGTVAFTAETLAVLGRLRFTPAEPVVLQTTGETTRVFVQAGERFRAVVMPLRMEGGPTPPHPSLTP
ncbi:MAG TPA: hypothetical protein VFX70_04175, partial [Mycobacteriales bacterium]|nr:hypothetical protein [Mycobacteriales bacterium]